MKLHKAERTGYLFDALSHPTRLRIVELICTSEMTANGIAATIGISQSGTSQHLAILVHAGVLVVEVRGSSRIYRIVDPQIEHILMEIEAVGEDTATLLSTSDPIALSHSGMISFTEGESNDKE